MLVEESVNMQKKIKIKFLFKIFIFFLIAIFSTSFVSSCGSFVVIDSRGSSSMQPFLAELGNVYSKFDNVEISVQAGGSAIGISESARGLTGIGNASKSPRLSIESNRQLKQYWQENNLKTITIAKDAIGIILLAPSGTQSKDFVIDQNNISLLYKAFAGYEKILLNKFYKSNNNSIPNDIYINGFARSGGANTSGTAEAFLYNSGFNKEIELDKKTRDALINGKYGNITKQTNESNAEAYNNFKLNAKNNDSRGGAMIYLSLGFILNNIRMIKNDGFSLMWYENKNELVEPSLDNINEGKYKWIRPFNVMISLNLKKNKQISAIKRFIESILFTQYNNREFYDDNIKPIFDNHGLVEINDDELKKQFLLNDEIKNLEISELITNHKELFWRWDYEFNPLQYGLEF